jgi:DNA-binding response OmpR family regulator
LIHAAHHNFSDVQVALFSPIHITREIHDAIHNAGFQHVDVINSIDTLHRAVNETAFDMIVLEAREQAQPIGGHVQDIRQGRLGKNPYVVINVATWKPRDEAIRAFVDAGTDDILMMPVSSDGVVVRTDSIIDHRRKFVATRRYLGPDRRNPNSSRRSELGGFSVPNGVRYKATGDPAAKPDRSNIESANRIANEQRLQRAAMQFD